MFHLGRKKAAASQEAHDENSLDRRQLREENAEQHATGLGISLNDFMEQFEADLAPTIADTVTLSGCARFELVTQRMVPGTAYAATDEVEQHLAISAAGEVRFRANTYHHGPGRLGIGRIRVAAIPRASVQEICRTLDTWLYMRDGEAWTQPADTGKWYLRVQFGDGREQVLRGALDGAFLPEIGMDISGFIRNRIPIKDLYLFDSAL